MLVVFDNSRTELSRYVMELEKKVASEPRPGTGSRSKPPVGAGRQAIKGNPLTHDEIEMFAMFEREGWTPEQRRSHILSICAEQRLRFPERDLRNSIR